uniref:Uncharacterized protein n=1 Tax=Fagus sylvatica TaxID=28930 RepID=A0A2N9J7A8_FAGSY
MEWSSISAWVERRSRLGCRSRLGVELDLGLGGALISAWGGAQSRPGWSADLGMGVGVVVIVWGGSCCGGDCVGDGWEKK